MAYLAHNTTSPIIPFLMGTQPIAGPRIWGYVSSHERSLATAANFFTDALDLGCKFGDMMFVWETSTGESRPDTIRISLHMWETVSATASELGIGTLVSSAS